jgi:hypothetical protein
MRNLIKLLLLCACSSGAAWAQLPGTVGSEPLPGAMGSTEPTTHSTPATMPASTKQNVREHLNEARDSFLAGDQPAAAKHVMMAVTALRADVDEVEQGSAQRSLRSAIKGLENLAGKLERKEVKSLDELKEAYGDAYEKLSWYHYEEAERMYRAHQGTAHKSNGVGAREDAARRNDEATTESWTQRMKYHIDESVDNFSEWSKETGHEMKENSSSAKETLQRWTGKAISGTGNVTEDVGEALNKWGEEMRSYGKGVQRRATANDAGSTETAHHQHQPEQ